MDFYQFVTEITDESLETAAQILFYVMAPQGKYWGEWYEYYDNCVAKAIYSYKTALKF